MDARDANHLDRDSFVHGTLHRIVQAMHGFGHAVNGAGFAVAFGKVDALEFGFGGHVSFLQFGVRATLAARTGRLQGLVARYSAANWFMVLACPPAFRARSPPTISLNVSPRSEPTSCWCLTAETPRRISSR